MEIENDIKLNDVSEFVVFIAFFSMVLFGIGFVHYLLFQVESIFNTLLIWSVIYLGLALLGEFVLIYQRSEDGREN